MILDALSAQAVKILHLEDCHFEGEISIGKFNNRTRLSPHREALQPVWSPRSLLPNRISRNALEMSAGCLYDYGVKILHVRVFRFRSENITQTFAD